MAEGLAPEVVQALVEDGRRIVITGAGGWIGLATLDLLAAALGDKFEKRVRPFGSNTRALRLADGSQVLQRPLADMAWLPKEPTIVLHTAFLTKDRAEAMDEAAYIAANRAISESVLKALNPIGAEAIFVASSGAAAKADDPDASAAMRLYGALKREDEERFAAWADETGHRAVIARIFALTGPYINKPGAYAIASFIDDAIAGRPVEVRAPRQVVRAYVAIRELMSLAFAASLAPSGVLRFDSGGEGMELGEIAGVVAAQTGTSVQRAQITTGPADIYHGDDAAYRALLADYGIAPVPLAAQVAEMIAWAQRSS
ncbi:NAD-dependent epimerase/dehydratase family protein [Novosphingobium sediminicola]|uniref:Nucleoside-diphosphate-sugar epimerase n=1 Tax=Novosphingobium sediminicola TaxID=563162 RepID=A0A7W6CMQ1_9SPHN|nr:NAD-dependent epimerase/dehydratase family protein [Novosphingobium sediminicola]MBB3955806.1 nucleoside-diphosphate-sugar epimerase [Novosphingobium sediminicola]